MNSRQFGIIGIAAALIAISPVAAIAAGQLEVVAKGDLKWKDMGVPGLASATVSGDMEKGASRFFLKYPVGFVTPKHHHSADHSGTIVAGTVTLTVDGKDYKLVPGSYFELTGKKPHVAKVEGNEEVVFFIQSTGPWDAVMEK